PAPVRHDPQRARADRRRGACKFPTPPPGRSSRSPWRAGGWGVLLPQYGVQKVSNDGTHYRKVFDSPYLSSMDVVDPITLTIARVTQEADKTKKSKETFNTAYFAEKFIRDGEKLKPMILNATNSKTMAKLVGSPFIEDWTGVRVTVYVERGIKF